MIYDTPEEHGDGGNSYLLVLIAFVALSTLAMILMCK